MGLRISNHDTFTPDLGYMENDPAFAFRALGC
jgi:hypothetical protein